MHSAFAHPEQLSDLRIGETREIAELHDGLEPRRLLSRRVSASSNARISSEGISSPGASPSIVVW